MEDIHGYDHSRILDVGCADGALWGGDTVNSLLIDGLDIDTEILELAKITGHYNDLYTSFDEVDVSLYDHILCLGVLEHVEDYWEFAEKLADSKFITFTVPNAWSPHRLLGYHMGIIKDLDQLDESDLSIGHKRVFDPELWQSFITIFRLHYGFDLVESGTIGFKPLTSGQLSEHSEALFCALDKTGFDLDMCGPNAFHGAELYAIMRKSK